MKSMTKLFFVVALVISGLTMLNVDVSAKECGFCYGSGTCKDCLGKGYKYCPIPSQGCGSYDKQVNGKYVYDCQSCQITGNGKCKYCNGTGKR